MLTAVSPSSHFAVVFANLAIAAAAITVRQRRVRTRVPYKRASENAGEGVCHEAEVPPVRRGELDKLAKEGPGMSPDTTTIAARPPNCAHCQADAHASADKAAEQRLKTAEEGARS